MLSVDYVGDLPDGFLGPCKPRGGDKNTVGMIALRPSRSLRSESVPRGSPLNIQEPIFNWVGNDDKLACW